MTERVNNTDEAKRVLKELWRNKRFFVLFFSFLYLYPVLTKDFLKKYSLDLTDLGSFFLTSFVIVTILAVLGIFFKHILIFIPAAICFMFLFVSFFAYLMMNND